MSGWGGYWFVGVGVEVYESGTAEGKVCLGVGVGAAEVRVVAKTEWVWLLKESGCGCEGMGVAVQECVL